MKRSQVDLDRLPDTGSLRGDLLGLFKPQSVEEGERKLKVMAGLTSMLSQHQGLAEAANAAIVEPWADAHRALMHRAVDRGEIPASADIETVSQVIPSMAAYRAPHPTQALRPGLPRLIDRRPPAAGAPRCADRGRTGPDGSISVTDVRAVLELTPPARSNRLRGR